MATMPSMRRYLHLFFFIAVSWGNLSDRDNKILLLLLRKKSVLKVPPVSSGESHAVALLADGTVKAWGYNGFGQLGDGTTTDRNSPVEVQGLSKRVTAIVAGGFHTLALLADGTVKAWGNNGNGQLGDGTTTDRNSPVDVQGLPKRVTAIVAGSFHTLALLANGTVKAWGNNGFGQLGDGTTTDRNSPVLIGKL